MAERGRLERWEGALIENRTNWGARRFGSDRGRSVSPEKARRKLRGRGKPLPLGSLELGDGDLGA